jgi:beta-1,2-mannobiose phosphorylase / 1,2-beta-oligomannan phosphorylase
MEMTISPALKLKRADINPVLAPHPDHPWENLAVCNPGVWYEDGLFTMIYRAAGDDFDHVIRFGLATSRDGIHFERASDQPLLGRARTGRTPVASRIRASSSSTAIIISPMPTAPSSRGNIGSKPDNAAFSPDDDTLPELFGRNMTASGLLVSDDLRSFRRLGRITRADVDDRDVILFPGKVGGRYAMLHRPMQWVGPDFGTDYPAIWISFSDNLLDWNDSTLLMRNEFDWERKVGGATPPILTAHGWFMLYHAVDENGVYRVGAVMLDLDDPTRVIARTRHPIMEPDEDFEWNGLYPHGVVFPTGNVVVDGTIYVYYGAADQAIGVATADFEELVNHVFSGKLSHLHTSAG